jgi:hypothetical protein
MRLGCLSAALVPCLALIALACAAQGATVEGSVIVVGNEPFTSVAIQTADGMVYRVSASRDLERRLRQVQGRKIVAEYSQMDSTAEGVKIILTNFKALTQ